MTRPIILTFTKFYIPGYKAGGPIQSIANIAEHLGDDFDFRIITGDRDSGDQMPYEGITPCQWQSVGNAKVWYAPRAQQTLPALARLMRETPHDAIYCNSFLHPRFTLNPLLAHKLRIVPSTPTIVAPRGEFSPGALGLKSTKKRAYIAAAKALGLYNNVLWQASSNHEADDIRTIFGAQTRIHIASNLPRAVQSGLQHPIKGNNAPLRVVFLSRISPKKNLTFALEVLANVRVPVDFSIVGNIDTSGYWDECQRLIATLPAHIKVKYAGVVPAHEVPHVMAQHDLFFLPTLGENFGHVIIEALSAGTPALISDQTPWQDFEANRCGWVDPLGNPTIYASRIEAMFEQTPQETATQRQAALAYARNFTEDQDIIEANRALFHASLNSFGT